MTSLSAAGSKSGDYQMVRLDRCAVFVSFARPVSVGEEDALQILHASFELTKHRQYVILVDMALVKDVTPEARRVFLSARNILAAAMLGNRPMDRMLSAPYQQAIYPGAYFTDTTEALQWLRLMHDRLCQDPVEHTMSLTVDLDPFRGRPRSATHAAG